MSVGARGAGTGSASARALLAALALAGCVHDVHVVGPVAPRPPALASPVRVLVFGDFGYRTVPQRLVARGIRRAAAARPFDLAVELGDNLYFCGPDPARGGACEFGPDGATLAPGAVAAADPIFRVNERPLDGLRDRAGGPLPIYLALGNHDVASGGRCAVPGLPEAVAERRRACLEVAHRAPAWTMPARHYVIDRGPIRIVVLDTNVVTGDYGGFTLEDEIAFLRRATDGCGAGRLCFVAGHHPPAAVHGYRVRRGPLPTPAQLRMARLVAAAGGRVRAWLGGHVHTLEHLSLDGLEVFVSGSTAMGGFMPFKVRTPARAQLRFATSAWGWAELEAAADGYRVAFRDFTGAPLHCCAAAADGPCRAVECG